MSRILFSVTAAGLVLAANTAHAAEEGCMMEADGICLGFIIPDRGCATTILTDVQLTAATTNWTDFRMRGTAEVGGMWAVQDHKPAHLGVTFAISGTEADPDDPSSRPVADSALLMRTRYWMPPFPGGPSMILDAAAGPALVVGDGEDPIRYGGYFEIGTSLHGMLGLFFAAQPTVSSEDQTLSTRYALGAKTTASGFLIVLSLYVCSQSKCY
jgi:hypothetical protein